MVSHKFVYQLAIRIFFIQIQYHNNKISRLHPSRYFLFSFSFSYLVFERFVILKFMTNFIYLFVYAFNISLNDTK